MKFGMNVLQINMHGFSIWCHFQYGGHDAISCIKVLPPSECTCHICSAAEFASSWSIVHSFLSWDNTYAEIRKVSPGARALNGKYGGKRWFSAWRLPYLGNGAKHNQGCYWSLTEELACVNWLCTWVSMSIEDYAQSVNFLGGAGRNF